MKHSAYLTLLARSAPWGWEVLEGCPDWDELSSSSSAHFFLSLSSQSSPEGDAHKVLLSFDIAEGVPILSGRAQSEKHCTSYRKYSMDLLELILVQFSVWPRQTVSNS